MLSQCTLKYWTLCLSFGSLFFATAYAMISALYYWESHVFQHVTEPLHLRWVLYGLWSIPLLFFGSLWLQLLDTWKLSTRRILGTVLFLSGLGLFNVCSYTLYLFDGLDSLSLSLAFAPLSTERVVFGVALCAKFPLQSNGRRVYIPLFSRSALQKHCTYHGDPILREDERGERNWVSQKSLLTATLLYSWLTLHGTYPWQARSFLRIAHLSIERFEGVPLYSSHFTSSYQPSFFYKVQQGQVYWGRKPIFSASTFWQIPIPSAPMSYLKTLKTFVRKKDRTYRKLATFGGKHRYPMALVTAPNNPFRQWGLLLWASSLAQVPSPQLLTRAPKFPHLTGLRMVDTPWKPMHRNMTRSQS
ncbi:MAG: hypothetical protein EP343_02365 [Deltaproteobacteria bacterium]|nr:MAG: hypothetical protein EP343_02365 [Deltaproteobacteria bacterium]